MFVVTKVLTVEFVGLFGEAVGTYALLFLHIGASTDDWFLAQKITVKSPIYRDLVAKSRNTCKNIGYRIGYTYHNIIKNSPKALPHDIESSCRYHTAKYM